MENTLNSRKKKKNSNNKNVKILLSYDENTSDVYNLAQKLDNSVQIVRRLLVTHDGGKLSRVGELSLAGAFTR